MYNYLVVNIITIMAVIIYNILVLVDVIAQKSYPRTDKFMLIWMGYENR